MDYFTWPLIQHLKQLFLTDPGRGEGPVLLLRPQRLAMAPARTHQDGTPEFQPLHRRHQKSGTKILLSFP